MVSVCPTSCNGKRFLVRAFLILLSVVFLSYSLYFVLFTEVEREQLYKSKLDIGENHYTGKPDDVKDPVILWWTPFTKQVGRSRMCGKRSCFFTEDRLFFNHSRLHAIMFYGSELEIGDLPLPRQKNHDWALLHEESPKNNFLFCMPNVLGWFNHTATYSRHSDLPLTLQYLSGEHELIKRDFYQDTSKKNQGRVKLAPIAYVQSDCNTPLERDAYVSELMNHIEVDSYGKCIHNRDLPKGLTSAMHSMDDASFWHLLARYKFHLAIENYISEDYITEKLWRPLIVGSVPIYMGSPSVSDWLPNGLNSTLLVSHYSGAKELAEQVSKIDSNDSLYESFLAHKILGKISNSHFLDALKQRKWGTNNDPWKPNFVQEFECLVCERIWRRLEDSKKVRFVAGPDHYTCDAPKSLLKEQASNFWSELYRQARYEAEVLNELLGKNKPFRDFELQKEVIHLLHGTLTKQ